MLELYVWIEGWDPDDRGFEEHRVFVKDACGILSRKLASVAGSIPVAVEVKLDEPLSSCSCQNCLHKTDRHRC